MNAMVAMDHFPYLRDFLGGYFHQDAYDDGQDDNEVLRDFETSSWPFQRLGVRADIGRFLHEHPDDLLQAFERAFSPGLTLARDDAQLRAWLQKVDAVLAK